VLGGNLSRIPDPHANFVDAFKGHTTPYGLTTALYRIIFSYAGYENAFNVVNEVKVCSRASRSPSTFPHPGF
jgi:hypothetical protein